MRFWKRWMAGFGIPSFNADALCRLDPMAMHIEDIAEVLGVRITLARWICDTAVRRGEFIRRNDGLYALVQSEVKP